MNVTPAHAEFRANPKALRRKTAAPPERAGFGPFDHESMERQFLLIEESHAELLTAAAAQALRDARYHHAFMFADRRCRIKPLAGAAEYLLRAGALSRLGEHTLARADLTTALEIDPNHILANLTALRAASGKEKLPFATAIIQNDTSFSPALHEAVKAASAEGCSAVGAFGVTPDRATGWIAWSGEAHQQLCASSEVGSHSVEIATDPSHPMAQVLGNAAEFSLAWPDKATYLKFDWPSRRYLIVNTTLLRPQLIRPPRRFVKKRPSSTEKSSPAPVAVIIPVYGDYEATQRCLHGLMNTSESRSGVRFVIVNDASPDKRIHSLVHKIAEDSRTSVLTHRLNFGFARSINDALSTVTTDEDVVLLNADTIVPPNFISRLAKAAHTAADIGTVTPFSNNGEYTSFPVPFRENPLPAADEVIAIDRIAAKENAGQIIDMPNGTAFCMYVTRSCLDAIGPLSTDFGKGYYEDVEFCLRAAKAGFRNICAADVYVGHAGSKSFGGSKRALVARNLAKLEAAYPTYRSISAAFIEADPLAPARQAIEMAALGHNAASCLLITTGGTAENLVVRRSAELADLGQRVLIANVQLIADSIDFQIRAADGGIPQNIRAHISVDETSKALPAQLDGLNITKAELLDLDETPAAVVEALLGHQMSLNVFVPPSRAETVPVLVTPLAPYTQDDDGADGIWAAAISHASELLVSNEQTGQLLAKRIGSQKPIRVILSSSDTHAPSLASTFKHEGECRIGIIGRNDASTQALVAQLVANTSPRLRSDMVFLGSAFDDLRLMAAGRIFCTGAIETPDLANVIALYGVSHILIADDGCATDRQLHPALTRAFPVARLDLAADQIAVSEDGALTVPAGASISSIVKALNRWTARQTTGANHG